MNPKVLYLDNHLLALYKPAGMLTQPSGTSKENLESWGKLYLKQRFQKPGQVFLEAVHRLDTPVNGIVLFARTSKALSRLQQTSRNRELEKIYLAWVEGNPQPQEGTLRHFLAHQSRKSQVVKPEDPRGKESLLQYEVQKKENNTALLKIRLLTGRYHQIRCQLAAMGWPILGDKKYGATQEFKGKGIGLTHAQLTFIHPIKKEKMSFDLHMLRS